MRFPVYYTVFGPYEGMISSKASNRESPLDAPSGLLRVFHVWAFMELMSYI